MEAGNEAEMGEQVQAKCLIGSDYPSPIVYYKEQKVMALKLYTSL